MVSRSSRPKLLVIVGPTASGKSGLALKIAEEFDGEVICADSRTVYKGMDIGTAKPTEEDQAKVKHWGLDLVEPAQRFTAYQFKEYAQSAISDIQGRGKLPILVGGTGLYIDSVIFDFGFRADADLAERKKLEALDIEALQDFIREMSLSMPFNFKNRRHLIRTIETKGQLGTKKSRLDQGIILVGLMPSDSQLKRQIEARVDNNFQGLALETAGLINIYGEKGLLATAGIAYKISTRFINGEIDEERAKELINNADWQYARRQKTWFKRNPHIDWFNSSEATYEFVKNRLLNT